MSRPCPGINHPCPGTETVQKGQRPFWTKGLQSAARIICSLKANKFHTCRLRSIFAQVHALGKNDCICFAACGRQTLRSACRAGYCTKIACGRQLWLPSTGLLMSPSACSAGHPAEEARCPASGAGSAGTCRNTGSRRPHGPPAGCPRPPRPSGRTEAPELSG